MWDLQAACVPLVPQVSSENLSAITSKLVLIAEVDDVHVGFCIAFIKEVSSAPIFIQAVAVAPQAQQRGVGLELLLAVAGRAPERDIAMATQDTNVPARTLNERFAEALNSEIKRVTLGTYADADLAIRRGQGYRSWRIQRPG